MRYAEEQAKSPQDFQPRSRLPAIVHFLLVFAGIYIFLAGFFLFSDNMTAFGFWAFFVLAGLAVFITRTVRFNRDLLLATEFQNAIFSSALMSGNLFSIIVRGDGSIVHVDRGTQDFFKGFSRYRHKHLEDILRIAQVSEEHQNAIFNALRSQQRERLLFGVTSHNGVTSDLVLTLDPITKPGNFTILRARAYSEKRAGGAGPVADAQAHAQGNLLSLCNKLPLGIICADAQGSVSYVNASVEQWLGYAPGEIQRLNLTLAQIVVEPLAAFGRGETSGEILFLTKDHARIALFCLRFIEQSHDRTDMMAAIIYPPSMDKARTVAAESGALKSDQDALPAGNVSVVEGAGYEQFLNTAPIAIAQCDVSGNILFGNQVFRELVGERSKQLPHTLVDVVSSSKRAEAQHHIQQAMRGQKEHQHFQMEIQQSGAETVPVAVFASKSAHDVYTYYLIDVSEQKNLELRFAHSQKMQAVGQLAGGVAHDFNNLLTAMIGFCDLLLMRHPAGDQSFADIMQIKQNANRAANLVRQLLAFSRRQTLQPKNLDITDVLAELSNLIRRLIGENIELKMMHGRDLGMVKADQGQLEQVIINLAVNARDAMKNGGLLTIRSQKATISRQNPLPKALMAPAGEDSTIPDGEYVLIEVSDTGTGIPAHVLPKIFEPFFSTKEIGSGTGLGLSTVYGIIKQTGGYIYVASAEGHGTQFHMYFPSYAAEEKSVVEPDSVDRSHQDLTGRETLLLVEDEAPVRAFASRALKNKGYTVIEADCAETALELVKEHGSKLDLIITDVIMPGMNGPSMVEKISVDYPDIKVIFISGYAEDVFMHSYGSERSFNFLAKPFTLKQLAGKVKDVLLA